MQSITQAKTRHKQREKQLEKRALKVSLFGTFVMSGTGLLVGFIVNSQAILLDGIFSLLSMGMTGLALYTTQLIHRPDDDTFQFGYAHFEPLTIVLQGVVILAICIVAMVTGVQGLLHTGSSTELNSAFAYAVFSTLMCFGIYRYERRIIKQCDKEKSPSELIAVDSQEWLIDTVLSATLLVGFLGAMLLKGTAYDDFIPFIDPSLTVLLALLASILPIKVISKNIKEVLLVSPIQTNERIQEALENIIAEYHFTD